MDCHFLLECMKVKSEREVSQSCLTICDPMDRSLPGSSVHGIFQARVLEWGVIAFSHPRSRAPHCSLSPGPLLAQGLEETWDHESLGGGGSLSWIRTEQGRAWSQTCPPRPEPPLEPQGLISASLRLVVSKVYVLRPRQMEPLKPQVKSRQK